MSADLLGQRGAVFSDNRVYRYELWRRWDDRPSAMFVGVNPSTADEYMDDPTIRRCVGFARDWGYGGLVMTNLFGFCATDPKVMRRQDDPVGPGNDAHLARCAREAGVVIAAWGIFGRHLNRAQAVVDAGLLGSFAVLGLTRDGYPRHPLYMPERSRPLDPLTLEAIDAA